MANKKKDLSKAFEKLAGAKDKPKEETPKKKNKGGRPSHTTKGTRQQMTITLSKSTIKRMQQSLIDNADPIARNKSHMIEIAVLQYLDRLEE